MPTDALAPKLPGPDRLLSRSRLKFTLVFSILIALPFGLGWKSGLFSLLERAVVLGLTAMLVFGLLERWPRRLPGWLARWALQVIGVALAMPLATLAIYLYSTDAGAPPFWEVKDRVEGFGMITFLSLLIAPWAVLAALVRQKEAMARQQALEFDLARSELERQALDARLHLMQAQVAPHFLFNTLANIQALVDSGSPQASAVLRSLVAYLRAAVPRLNETATTLGQELQLVQAYLELMHMRMPDRLSFTITADDGARGLRCPTMTLMTLVENAVRHGIDPGEEGGRIDIEIRREGSRCQVRVRDTGAGLQPGSDGLGTGLSTLRERLRLIFGNEASLRLGANEPRGVVAEIGFPAIEVRR